MRTRVKICGITSVEDAQLAVRHGADAIGLVFYPDSPRAVGIAQAQQIAKQLPAFVSCVGLFVNAEEALVNEVLSQVGIDVIQFHGDEPPAACERYHKRYIKAVNMHDGINLDAFCQRYEQASAILVDSAAGAAHGGTGKVFDWKLIPSNLSKPIILAGGLNAENVANAVATVRPYAVDVSSGVEQSKGVKDEQKIVSFIRGVESVKSE